MVKTKSINPDDYGTLQLNKDTRIRLSKRRKRITASLGRTKKESYDHWFGRVLDLYEKINKTDVI